MSDTEFKPLLQTSPRQQALNSGPHSDGGDEPAFVPLTGKIIPGAPQAPAATPEGYDKNFIEHSVDVLSDLGKGAKDAYNGATGYVLEGLAETGNALGIVDDEDIQKFRTVMGDLRQAGRGEPTVTEGVLGEAIKLSPIGGGVYKGLTSLGVKGTPKLFLLAEAVSAAFATNPDAEVVANLLPEDGDSDLMHNMRDILATDPNDPEWNNRARKTIEVMGLGVAAEGVVSALRKVASKVGKGGGEALEEAVGDSPSPEVDLEAPTAPEAPIVSQDPAGEAFSNFQSALKDVKGEIKDGKDAFQTTPLNMSKVRTPDEVKQVMESLARTADEDVLADWTEVETLAEASRLADELLLDPEDVMNTVEGMAFGSKEHTGYLLAAKRISIGQHEAVQEAITRVELEGTDAAMEDFYEKFLTILKTDNLIKQVQRSGARMTSAGRVVVEGADAVPSLDGVDLSSLADPSPEALRKLAGQLKVIPPENLRGWKRVIKRISTSKKWDITNEFFINAILSGPATHAVNMISNTVETFLKPMESLIGGAITRNPDMMRSSMNQYVGMVYSLRDSVKLMAAAARKEDAVLDPHVFTIETNNKAMGNSSLAQALRLPSRALLTSDELFKQVNYRSKLFSLGMDKAPTELARKERVAWALDYVNKGIDQRTGKAINKEALQYARETTFTEELRAGTFSRTFQEAANKHPAMKTIVPFIRTPTNLIKHQFRRTPGIGMLSKQMREDWAAGGTRRATAIGKQATGGVFTAAGFALAYDGTLTGSGPTNYEARKKLMDTGWRPYSFKTTDENGKVSFIPYKRGDPRFMMFGVMADAVDVIGNLDESKASELSAAILYSISQNLSNKTYFKGMSDAMDAAFSGDMKTIQRFIGQQVVGHTVPFNSALRQTNQDPYLREVRSLVDHYRNAIPGLSPTLEPRRNVMGEPMINPAGVGLDKMNPFHSSEWKNENVYEELAKYGATIKNPPTKKNGIDLLELKNKKGQTAYDRWLELLSKETVGNRGTLKEALTEAVRSERYLQELDDPEEDYNGSRRSQILALIGKYRDRSYRRLMGEFPEIREGQQQDRRELMMKRLGFRE
ncbi:hypothetical protein [Paremcibacter congregatus]|uniref:Large polyvalent protein associated domain-containing protein n=1 Tax=Paremcibacter congregatus TaxID=2043170 RepID=A0A2G4YWV7_9PROT|nr:hypothetical protein [Paremcibacter congregatus]PHZ85926.1 hypothetical protein CRD36_04425 [Paremcibacter congregatus]QDE26891.1 hypothetical protein FIV45_06195 [Paremcibacter congregatus]